MVRRRAPMLCCLITGLSLLVACGGDTTAPAPTMAGSWAGTIDTQQSMTLQLSETGATVSGSGSIGSTLATVHGTHQTGATSTLTLTTTGGATITFTVEVLLPKAMTGRLNGGGFSDDVAALDRQ